MNNKINTYELFARYSLDLTKILIAGVILTLVMQQGFPAKPLLIIAIAVVVVLILIAYLAIYLNNRNNKHKRKPKTKSKKK